MIGLQRIQCQLTFDCHWKWTRAQLFIGKPVDLQSPMAVVDWILKRLGARSIRISINWVVGWGRKGKHVQWSVSRTVGPKMAAAKSINGKKTVALPAEVGARCRSAQQLFVRLYEGKCMGQWSFTLPSQVHPNFITFLHSSQQSYRFQWKEERGRANTWLAPLGEQWTPITDSAHNVKLSLTIRAPIRRRALPE